MTRSAHVPASSGCAPRAARRSSAARSRSAYGDGDASDVVDSRCAGRGSRRRRPRAGRAVEPDRAVHLGGGLERAGRAALAPAATGTSRIPASVQMRSAFRVTLSSSPLPATVVIARRSSSGLAAASSSATASSWPGSQSTMHGRAINRRRSPPGTRVRRSTTREESYGGRAAPASSRGPCAGDASDAAGAARPPSSARRRARALRARRPRPPPPRATSRSPGRSSARPRRPRAR